MKNIKYKLRSFFYSISNLSYYWKTIVNDRPWDYLYIVSLLEKKLQRVYNHYTSKKPYFYILKGINHEDEIVKPLRICLEILKRQKTDWYSETWHDLNFPDKSKNSFSFKEISEKTLDGQKLFELIRRDPVYPDTHPLRSHKAFYRAEERDWKLLFAIMEKYMRNWWD